MKPDSKKRAMRQDIDRAIDEIAGYLGRFDPGILPLRQGIGTPSAEGTQISVTMHVIRR